MRLNLKATNMTLTDETREYLYKRLQSLEKLIHFDDPAVLVDVELGRTTRHHQTGDVCRAEINLHMGKENFRAVSERESLTAAIDDVRDEVEREVTSKKKKNISLTRRGGQAVKALLQGSYNGLEYLGRPAKAGLKYLKGVRPWKWWGKR